jgi:MoaA/NifB/PqqE/SkfB family radical SAM enzyme
VPKERSACACERPRGTVCPFRRRSPISPLVNETAPEPVNTGRGQHHECRRGTSSSHFGNRVRRAARIDARSRPSWRRFLRGMTVAPVSQDEDPRSTFVGASTARHEGCLKAATFFSFAKARVFGLPAPIAVGFELTHLCNLACLYCDRHTPLPSEMTYEQILSALEGLCRIGMQEISLDGGEPLTHRRVGDIVDWLVERDIVVRMNTNGILVRRKSRIVRKLAKVKISLDGSPSIHDSVRGLRAFERAVDGANAARELGVPVELTCVVGRHNAHAIDEIVDVVRALGLPIIFQPARDSLFLDGHNGPGSPFRLGVDSVRRAFERVAHHKREGAPVLNGWASLRHFQGFPNEQPIPCAAGWINATLDPEGNLYHCGQVSRRDKSNNVVQLGAEEAFRRLVRKGCTQCWCARVVEENYAWGGRLDMTMPLRAPHAGPEETRLVAASSGAQADRAAGARVHLAVLPPDPAATLDGPSPRSSFPTS